jgi:hypothetical protein
MGCITPIAAISTAPSGIATGVVPDRPYETCGSSSVAPPATIGDSSLRDDERNSALPWLPKKSYPPIDTVQKPYYCESRNKRRRRLATTALPGLAPVRSTRASAATHRESISPCRHADLGVANGKVTIRSDGIRLSAAFLRPARAHLRRAEINP